jgi:TatA/E family protein of Tat protein translocase
VVVGAVVLLFGGSKLPEFARALGQSKKAFKEGMASGDDNQSARATLNDVDDETLFAEARRRAQQLRANDTKKIEG